MATKKSERTIDDKKIRELRNKIETEDYSQELADQIDQRVNQRGNNQHSRHLNRHRHFYVSTNLFATLYLLGALIAGGINFALTHSWLRAILHGLLSWAYIAYSWMSGVFPH